MNWKDLTDEAQLDAIRAESKAQPVVIFKHSTRCNISSMAKSRLDRGEAPEGTSFYYLDLIKYRTLSHKVAEVFEVHHESPQVLVIKDGDCVYDESHNGISLDEVLAQAK